MTPENPKIGHLCDMAGVGLGSVPTCLVLVKVCWSGVYIPKDDGNKGGQRIRHKTTLASIA